MPLYHLLSQWTKQILNLFVISCITGICSLLNKKFPDASDHLAHVTENLLTGKEIEFELVRGVTYTRYAVHPLL
jgi:hypothetical protein